MSEPIKNRYDFTILFDVENGNPNGDPDAGNMPRIDPEEGYGLVTDVCIKRKIRNYVETAMAGEEGYRIYIRDGVLLADSEKEAIEKADVSGKEKNQNVLSYMCSNFFDIRAFGAVMTSFMKNGYNCGQVRGPVQLSFARSIDPIVQQEVTITRIAVANEERAKKNTTETEMGRKYIIPYALYRMDGYISANLAQKTTRFSEEDLQVLWKAIGAMFEDDHSAARGKMATRGLYVFRHDSVLGNAPSWKLFDSISILRKDGVASARSFKDYVIHLPSEGDLPEGVKLLTPLS